MSDENLGRAVLALATDDSALDKGLAEGQKKAKGWAKGLGGDMSGILGAAVGVIAGGAVIAGVGKLVGVLGDCAAEAAEAARIEAQLNAVLKSTGSVAGVTARQVKGLASSLSDMTGVEDDSIIAAENVLLTFTKIGQQVFPDAVASAMDMSVAMGQDLQTSIVQVGKALNDPIAGMTALRKVGVSFSEAQQDQIKNLIATNDLMGAQKLILAELSAEFGGSAVAAGETYAGTLNKLQNKIDNIKEMVGAELILRIRPVVENVVMPVVEGVEAGIAYRSSEAETRMAGLKALIEQTKAELTKTEASEGFWGFVGKLTGDTASQVERLRAQLALYEQELAYVETSQAEWGDSGVANARRVTAALEGTAAAATTAATAMQDAYGISQDYIGPDQLEANRAAAEIKIKRIRDEKDIAAAGLRAQTDAASQAADAYRQAFDAVASKIASALDDAIGKSKGLLDLSGGDKNAPGANGAFEGIFRAAAIAKGGIEGAEEAQWAQMYGLTPESAAQIVSDFQNGLMTEGVKRLIDMPMLINQVQIADQAAKMKEAFVNEIAKQAGVGKGVVQALIEPNESSAAATTAQAGQLATDVATQFANEAGQFTAAGKAWMDQLAAGIKGQIPVLTQAASEVVTAFLTAIRNAITLTPPPAPAGVTSLLGGPGSGPPTVGNGVTVNGLTIHVPSGDPRAVAQATQDGLLRAARAMGLRG